MSVVTGKLEGSQTITGELHLHGMIVGDAIVESGGTIFLNGMVTGNLLVKSGGTAHINEMVSGSVRNGGDIQVAGMVVGAVSESEGAKTIIHSDSMINGVRQ